MSDATRLKLAYFFTLLAIVMLGISIVGMTQTPRPEWTRGLLIPALVFVLVGSVLRRRVRRRA